MFRYIIQKSLFNYKYNTFYNVNVFFEFLSNTFQNDYEITSKSKFGTKMCSFGSSITLP